MTYWQDLLSEHPHTCRDDGHLQFSTQPPAEHDVQLIPRTDLAVLRATGGDWRKMLQGQTTCDLTELSDARSVPGALCTPKGRVIANFRLLQDGDDVLLISTYSAADPLLETLRKFAPFFKVSLDVAALPLLATLTHASSISDALTTLGGSTALDVNEVAPWQAGKLIVVSARQILVTLDKPTRSAWQTLTTIAAPSDTTVATLAEIRDGLAWVTDKTSGEFIPQMLGLHRTGAVSFKKGCYTGQEVVARMHYLGNLKRQLYRMALQLQNAPAAGTPCYLPDAQQNCGHIVMSAPSPTGGTEVLAVLTDDGAQSASLRLGADSDATAASPLPLPFPEDPA